jgi:hypothetical protein
MPIENLTNMFKNIKILEFKSIRTNEVKFKINLPYLTSISNLYDSRDLQNFTGLKSLRKIRVNVFDFIKEIDEVFDPKQITDLSIKSL